MMFEISLLLTHHDRFAVEMAVENPATASRMSAPFLTCPECRA